MPKLSIVIPVYNVEKYLAACLDSCVEPGRAEEYEIVAVNDGSTDGSGAILADYAARYPRLLRVETTENGGLGHARNTGTELARGDYIAYVDSDDTLAPGAVGGMLDCLDGGFDIAFFDFVAVSESGRELSYTRGCAGEAGVFRLEDRPEIIFGPPNAWNKIWRRSLFSETGLRFPDRLWFEDLATSPRLFLRAGALRYIPQCWYRYLLRSGSITNSANAARNREMLTVIDGVMRDYREQGAWERYERELCYLALYFELLTSTTRVNLIDPHSPVQDELLEDFLRRFPDWEENPYAKRMPARYRLLLRLILGRRRGAVNLLMRANNIVRRKDR